MSEVERLAMFAQGLLGWCPFCRHKWTQHDPEDGQCDSHRDDGEFGVCPCGREIDWMQERIAALSREFLAHSNMGYSLAQSLGKLGVDISEGEIREALSDTGLILLPATKREGP